MTNNIEDADAEIANLNLDRLTPIQNTLESISSKSNSPKSIISIASPKSITSTTSIISNSTKFNNQDINNIEDNPSDIIDEVYQSFSRIVEELNMNYKILSIEIITIRKDIEHLKQRSEKLAMVVSKIQEENTEWVSSFISELNSINENIQIDKQKISTDQEIMINDKIPDELKILKNIMKDLDIKLHNQLNTSIQLSNDKILKQVNSMRSHIIQYNKNLYTGLKNKIDQQHDLIQTLIDNKNNNIQNENNNNEAVLLLQKKMEEKTTLLVQHELSILQKNMQDQFDKLAKDQQTILYKNIQKIQSNSKVLEKEQYRSLKKDASLAIIKIQEQIKNINNTANVKDTLEQTEQTMKKFRKKFSSIEKI